MCAFSSVIFCCRKTSSCQKVLHLLETGGWGILSVGEGEELVRGGRSTLALVRQNKVQASCIYVEAAKQLNICAKR